MAQAIAGENYEFQAQPQVVKPNKAKYRPQPIEEARRSGYKIGTISAPTSPRTSCSING